MSSSTFIKLKDGSVQEDITIEDVKEMIDLYKQSTSHTAKQVAWDYQDRAFPYALKETNEGKGQWFYLYSEQKGYHLMAIGIDYEYITVPEEKSKQRIPYIEISLSKHSTNGDKSKANEFAKFLSKKLKAELHLFNGRIIHYHLKK